MKKRSYTYLSVLTIGFIFVLMDISPLFAQETAGEEFTLEEITVTAEKRTANIQSIPASVQAIPGSDLMEQGKITIAQILENVPNLVYATNNQAGRGGPDNNIAIRGIKRTQESGSPGPIPSATSTYVDGVFDGFGGEYDVERVEVLRGPQGTLYGRSATGGVVSTYTNNPKLGEFSGNVMAEYGSGNTINTQAAINVPAGDKVALRAAIHYLNQEYGFRFDDEGKGKEAKEARIKALFQPTDQLSAVLILSATDKQNKINGRGFTMSTLTPIDEINWKYSYFQPGNAIPDKFRLASLELNYNMSGSALTYIGALHTHKFLGLSAPYLNFNTAIGQNLFTGDPDKTQTHEIRWASNTDGPLSWLIGANYYKYTTNWNFIGQQLYSLNHDPLADNIENGGVQAVNGYTKDYGVFTEETLKLGDNMRLTGGLRYDKTKVSTQLTESLNINSRPLIVNGVMLGTYGINPPDLRGSVSEPLLSDFSNVTYKLRFEYDLTQQNMLYAMTATGFLPGNSSFTASPIFGIVNGGPGLTGLSFHPLRFQEEKLKSYEIGSKNRFMDNRLQANVAVFYEDYAGYQEATNVAPPMFPPVFNLVRLPVKIYGLETDLSWLITPYDKVGLTGGWMKAEATKYPLVPDAANAGQFVSAQHFFVLKKIPGLPLTTANLSYDHTFLFGNGSSLIPRAELRYTGAYYLAQLTQSQVTAGWLPYFHQDAVVLLNLGLSWFSPKSDYSITGYVRNATDKLYKTNVSIQQNGTHADVTFGDPRTYGFQVSVKF